MSATAARRWKLAVQQISALKEAKQRDAVKGDDRDGNTTFIGCKLFSVLIHHIEPVSDRQVHYGDDLYVQATLQGCGRQTDTAEAAEQVEWGQWLTFTNQEPNNSLLRLSVCRSVSLWRDEEVASAVLDVASFGADAPVWRGLHAVPLVGRKGQAWGDAALHVQLLASKRKEPPPQLSVLAATWNVGNAPPPPAPELRLWLLGCLQRQHHLVVVGAQECNYSLLTSSSAKAGPIASNRSGTLSQTSLPPGLSNGSSEGLPVSSSAAVAAETVATTTQAAAARTAPEVAAAAEAAAADAGREDNAAGCTSRSPAGPTPSSSAPAGVEEEGDEDDDITMAAAAGGASFGRDVSSSRRSGSAWSKQSSFDWEAAKRDPGKWLKQKQRALLHALSNTLDSALHWQDQVSQAVGSGYRLVAFRNMFQTRLLVFARTDVLPLITNVCGGFEATGVGGVGVNKGGVAVSLNICGTTLTFINSHLAAHQSKALQRSADVAEITDELFRGRVGPTAVGQEGDAVTSATHVVWVGDLNYRIDFGEQAVTQAENPTPQDWQAMTAAISAGTHTQQLLPLDQLAAQRAAGRVFVGFREPPITFHPTFKVRKGLAGCVYSPQRSPAWCDRVLVRSNLPHRQAQLGPYWSAEGIATSDHKPVAAVLQLPTVSHAAANTTTAAAGAAHSSSPAVKLRMVGVSLADAATQQLLLTALREHRDAVERAAGCRVRTGTGLLPQLQLVVAGSGVAGGKWVTVKLSRHAVQQALSSQQQQQVQGAGALGVIKDAGATATTPDGGATSNSAASGAAEAAHGINLMKHPVMVELEYPDVALAADGWVTCCLHARWGMFIKTLVARAVLPLQPLLTARPAAPAPSTSDSCPAFEDGPRLSFFKRKVRSRAQLQTMRLQLEKGTASLGHLDLQVQVLTSEAAQAVAQDAVARLIQLGGKEQA